MSASAVPDQNAVAAPGAAESTDGETFAFPLSFAQQRLWFLDQMEPGTALYNIPVNLRLTGRLDVEALRRTLSEIVRRHESLRTVFRMLGSDELPRQLVLPPRAVALPVEDLSALSEEARQAALERSCLADASAPFDLATGPLFRARLLRLGDDENVLVVVMHHIISDGWSLGVFVRELGRLYEAFAVGLPSPLPELGLQYADVAVWQREHLEGEALDQQVAYWRAHLTGVPAALEIPTDRPRPPVQTYPGASVRARFPLGLLDRLRALSRREEATLFMTLLAAWKVLLARWSGERDIVVGSPIAGRTYSELEELIGFFVNTLVLRSRVVPGMSFGELLASVRESTLGAYGNQDVPFERLVEELHPERDLSRPPLFQVMFLMQNLAIEATPAGSVEIDALPASVELAKFDISLAAVEESDGLRLELQYNTDLYEPATVERMAAHFGTLMGAIADDAGTPVGRLAMLPQEERALLISHWGRGPSGGSRETGMHGRFAEQARRTPDNVALAWEGGEATYAALRVKSLRLSRHLQSLGAGPGTLVGLCTERGEWMIVALLAVLEVGGAYVPLDPAYPVDRLEYMLEDSGARFLVHDRALPSGLAHPGVARVDLDRFAESAMSPASEGAPSSGESPEAATSAASVPSTYAGPHPESLAYVIYTSGSTGRPKGVMVRHGAVANFLQAMERQPGLDAADVLVAVTTLSFDIAVLELMLPLSTGARVVLASRETAADPGRLAALLSSSGATVMQATPATWRMLLDDGWLPPSGMKILSGGEALPHALAGRLVANGARLWNLYGPTETTVWSAAVEVEPEAEIVVVGGPIDATTFYVLAEDGEPAPLGAFGELYIGGEGLARGYLGRPGLTAERFVPDPFAPEAGARMYRTGDRVRWRANGALEIAGRLDTQVKLRGFRIELGEVEAALRTHPAVREAAAAVRDDAPGDPRLVGYVVGIEGSAPPASELAAHLRASLPEHMIPSAFVALERIPLTPNGKTDRRALPAPDASSSAATYEAPATPTETAIAGIWSELLHLPRVGATDNFFELGGHSLLATQVVARIRGALGASLPVRTLFEARTVRELARRVDEENSRGPGGARSIGAVSRDRYRIPVGTA